MADADAPKSSQTTISGSSLSTQQLRTLAQSHLIDIEQELILESQQQMIAKQDLQKYAKPRRKDRSHSPSLQSSVATVGTVKGPRFRSAQDVLDRLQWDPTINIGDYIVGYLERFEGILEMPASSWVGESTDEDFIPQHRIRYVKKQLANGTKETIWNRDERVDKLFGSGKVDETKSDDDGGVALTDSLY